jgi:hypothetical protein
VLLAPRCVSRAVRRGVRRDAAARPGRVRAVVCRRLRASVVRPQRIVVSRCDGPTRTSARGPRAAASRSPHVAAKALLNTNSTDMVTSLNTSVVVAPASCCREFALVAVCLSAGSCCVCTCDVVDAAMTCHAVRRLSLGDHDCGRTAGPWTRRRRCRHVTTQVSVWCACCCRRKACLRRRRKVK